MKRISRSLLVLVLLILAGCSAAPELNLKSLVQTPAAALKKSTPVPIFPTHTPTVSLNIPMTGQLEIESFRVKGEPEYSANTAHPDNGCFWMGISGQVFDIDGSPLKNYVLVVEGQLKDQGVMEMGMTGTTDDYGKDSYEILLSYMPVNTFQSLFITLYDLQGNQLSNSYRFNTYADCTRNRLDIDFQQVSPP
jgi:hypothetical protein